MKLELVRKYREEYIVNLASIGEPMDPELLNPARKRKDVKVGRAITVAISGCVCRRRVRRRRQTMCCY